MQPIENMNGLAIFTQSAPKAHICAISNAETIFPETPILTLSRRFDPTRTLSTNIIAGAGIDVYEKEPLPENNKLRFLPNALLTPHIGYVTAENYKVYYSQMIESLEACASGKPIRVIE